MLCAFSRLSLLRSPIIISISAEPFNNSNAFVIVSFERFLLRSIAQTRIHQEHCITTAQFVWKCFENWEFHLYKCIYTPVFEVACVLRQREINWGREDSEKMQLAQVMRNTWGGHCASERWTNSRQLFLINRTRGIFTFFKKNKCKTQISWDFFFICEYRVLGQLISDPTPPRDRWFWFGPGRDL